MPAKLMSPLFYTVFSWFACLLTAGLWAVVVTRFRYLFIKPSMVVLLFFHVCVQWSATIFAGSIWSYLPRPWEFALLVHGFPLVGFAGSFVGGHRLARLTLIKAARYQPGTSWRMWTYIVPLGLALALFFAYYLLHVPFRSTGLYAIVGAGENAAQARENSLKLVEDPVIRYGFAIATSSLAPALTVLLLLAARLRQWRGRIHRAVLPVSCFGLLVIVVSVTGARSFAAMLVLTAAFAVMLRRGFAIRPVWLLAAVSAIILGPTLLTLMREGQAVNLESVFTYSTSAVADRIFHAPMETGLYYAHYAQTAGPLGVGGIEKLAALLGVEPINAPNMLGRTYTPSYIESVNMNTSFVFAYYAYFGLQAFPLIVVLLWLLDFGLLIYVRLRSALLLTCVTTVSVSCINLVSVDYTVALVTHGLAVNFLLAILLSQLSVKRHRPNEPRPQSGMPHHLSASSL